MHAACFKGNQLIAELLGKSGADFYCKNEDGYSGFFLAALNGYDMVLREAFNHSDTGTAQREKINEKSHSWTPLYAALSKGHKDVALWLLGHGAVCTVTDDETGNTELHLAVSHGLEKVVDELLRNYEQSTAAISSEVPPVEAWIAKRNRNNYTAIHLAAKKGAEGVVEMLFRKHLGSEYSEKETEKWTALHWAVRSHDVQTVMFLITSIPEIKINAKDSENRSPEDLVSISNCVGKQQSSDICLKRVSSEYQCGFG